MTVQEIPTELALQQSICKAQMCQDIFRHILNDRSLTRITILDYILSEAEQLTTLSQSLLALLNMQEAARLAATKTIISSINTPEQVIETAEFTDGQSLDSEP